MIKMWQISLMLHAFALVKQNLASNGSFSFPRNHVRLSSLLVSMSQEQDDADLSKDVAVYGENMDQLDMMEKDLLICVDGNDVPVGKMSKKEAHAFGLATPRGWVHRAFSVFLFNDKGEMLITKRASNKITFPDVWTNACCSHPLWGQIPNEVDDKSIESYPDKQPTGVKYAAIRKLLHELGIEKGFINVNDLRFLTRFHYWAADTVTYKDSEQNPCPWGEHEIDYILFCQCKDPASQPVINANPDEVGDFKYVSIEELKEMMYSEDSENGIILWSPWFRGIMEKGGFEMWENLSEALEENSRFCNSNITYFNPPVEHTASYNLESHSREDTGIISSSSSHAEV